MKYSLLIIAASSLAALLLPGCAGPDRTINRQVRHEGKVYDLAIKPSTYLTKRSQEAYADLYVHGFQDGLKGDVPLIHFSPGLDPVIQRGWSEGSDRGLREYARYHWNELRDRLPGFYTQLKAEGFKPVR